MDANKQTTISKKIPKIIHQIWLGDLPRPEPWMATFEEKNPDFSYHLWTEDNIPTDLENQKAFDLATYMPQKVDILRYEILYRHGGIYLDSDAICLKSLDSLRQEYSFFTGYESEQHTKKLMANGVIGVCPGHPLMALLMKALDLKQADHGIECWKTTGPLFFTAIVNLYNKGADLTKYPQKIYDSEVFYPYHWCDFNDEATLKAKTLSKRAVLFHTWGAQFGYDAETVETMMGFVERLVVSG